MTGDWTVTAQGQELLVEDQEKGRASGSPKVPMHLDLLAGWGLRSRKRHLIQVPSLPEAVPCGGGRRKPDPTLGHAEDRSADCAFLVFLSVPD